MLACTGCKSQPFPPWSPSTVITSRPANMGISAMQLLIAR